MIDMIYNLRVGDIHAAEFSDEYNKFCIFLMETNGKYQKLVDAGIIQSMSRVGRCIDNGPMEGFWGILKSESYYLKRFTSKEELITSIEEYINFYNTKRYQTKLCCMAPMEYHAEYTSYHANQIST